jgi:hypothetical protein
MSQKPTEAVSSFLLNRKTFSLNDLVTATGIDRRKLLRVLEKFRKEGFLKIVGEEKVRPAMGENGPFRRNPRYQRIKDIATRQKKQRPSCGRDRIWRTIRYLRKFKRSDLIRLTGDKERTIYGYTRKLVIHGYLKDLGRSGREKVFLLFNDSGPKRPIMEGE